jgi:hypothetical protein
MLFVARPSLRVDWPWTPPVLWRLLPQSEAGFILVWYVGRRIVCMLLYWCGVVSVCWHLWFWSHSSGPYMMIPEYRLSHALPYTSLWIYGFLCAPLLRFPSQRLYHSSDASWVLSVIVADNTWSSALDFVKLVNLVRGVWIPYCRRIF